MIVPDYPIFDAALRLALASMLVQPLAWGREQRSHSAGPRTYALLSSCVCGFLLFAKSAKWGLSEQADVFYSVLTGIGFVGSGAVVKSGEAAHGMSTAVSLWVTGAIGAGVACEIPQLSAALSLMSALALRWPSLARSRRERS
jgi:putative Mg2+ transporter-C (MgtC) family protein